MKVLVTGGSGLVGTAIRKISSRYNYEFVFPQSKNYNLENLNSTIELFKKEKPDYVIHLAACVGGLYKNMNNKVEMLEKNLQINYNVIKCCHDYGVKKCISCLSTCIFPDKTSYPINESMLHNGEPHTSNDAYAYAKRMLEIHCKAYREQYNDDFVCVIPTNIYGPADNYHLEDAHVIPALIHKCYLNKKNNEPFTIRGSGKPLRQFIYSEDLAELIMWVLEKYTKKDTIILSVGEDDETSIEYIGKTIAKLFDYQHMVQFDDSYSDGQYKKTADNSKLMQLYDYKFTDIEVGLEKSVQWFVDNYDTCRK